MFFPTNSRYGKKKSLARRFADSDCGFFLRHRIVPWLRLVRLPNLLTAFGDSLAGACLATALSGKELSFWSVLDVCFCSVVLYMFGTIQNDWCDLPEDTRLRPERPLPNREISVPAAALVAIACLIVALLLAGLTGRITFIIALLLAVVISTYNFKLKHSLVSGSVCMGLCRGLNMLLGVSLVGLTPAAIFPVIGLTIYIGGVTWLADGENRRQIPTRNIFYPSIALGVSWFITLFFISGNVLWKAFLPSLLCIAVVIAFALLAAKPLYNRSTQPSTMHKFIGTLIGLLIPWQAAWVVFGATGHILLVLVLAIITWLLMKLASRWIAQS
jgi:4-hydroxybenzoate polyprenyltransferase